jgi:hypothetical protein
MCSLSCATDVVVLLPVSSRVASANHTNSGSKDISKNLLPQRCLTPAAHCRDSPLRCGCAVRSHSWCGGCSLGSFIFWLAINQPTCFDASNRTMQLPSTLFALLFTILPPASAVETTVFTGNESLWGPYRPNVYLGLRPRVPNSLIAGLMWGKLEDVEKSRHTR